MNEMRPITKFVFLAVVILTMRAVCPAQYQLTALEDAKKVKLLVATREDVKRVFANYTADYSELSEEYSLGDESVEAFYASGTCDETEEEVWDVPRDRVVRIEVWTRDDLTIDQLGLDLRSFEKERVPTYDDETYIYHKKREGLAIEVNEASLERFILVPPNTTKAKICNHKAAKEFVSTKSWYGKRKIRQEIACFSASVQELSLSNNEITALGAKKIEVKALVQNPQYDVLTYKYVVSAGRVVGAGQSVVWDLTSVPSGTYLITAAVDDGCGFCGRTVTKTVTVR